VKKRKVRQIVMEFMTEVEAQKRAARKPREPRKTAPKQEQVIAAADRAERKPIRISPELVSAAKRRADSYTRVNPFKLPDFPIQLMDHVPADRRMAMDDAISGVSAWAGGAWGNYGFSAAFEGVTFLGYPYLAELAQRPEYRVIVETIATEMTRKWIKLQAKGDVDKSEKIDELGEELERLKVRDIFCKASEVDGYFGRAHLYIDTGDTDNPRELLTPIGNGDNKISGKKIGKGDIKRLAVIEPTWTYPASYNSNNPLKPDWYNPQRWFVMASEVHASRLLRFVGREVPDMLKPAYSFGGLSLTQMAKPYVDNWLNIRQSVADIVQAFSVFVLGTNLAESLTPGGEQLFARADLFNNLRDNRGLMIHDKDTESFANVAAPLGTLDALQAQAQEHMAAVSRIPLVKLLGISPHGLNATAEPELRAFYDSILAQQEKFFTPNLRRIIAFAQLNLWGEVDPDITFAYEPLWSLDEKAAAEVRKLEAETGVIHIDGGVIDPEEERKRIANDPDTLYPGLVPEDLPDLKEEEEEGLEPKGSAEKLAGGENEEEEDQPA
jgi:phage-related protein (TIGR01555 family)